MVFTQIIFYFLSTDPTFIFSVDSTKGCVWLKCEQLSQGLSLSFDSLFFLSNSNQKICKPRPHDWWKLFVIAFCMASFAVLRFIFCQVAPIQASHSIVIDWGSIYFFLLRCVIKLTWWSQWGESSSIHLLWEFRFKSLFSNIGLHLFCRHLLIFILTTNFFNTIEKNSKG